VTVPRLFLVEHRLPRITDAELALLQATLNDTCLRLTARGETVRYLGSAYLPRPERLLSLFEAASADAVRTVSESSQAPASELEAAIVLPPPGRPGPRRPDGSGGRLWRRPGADRQGRR
jgi:hypothetical protein